MDRRRHRLGDHHLTARGLHRQLEADHARELDAPHAGRQHDPTRMHDAGRGGDAVRVGLARHGGHLGVRPEVGARLAREPVHGVHHRERVDAAVERAVDGALDVLGRDDRLLGGHLVGREQVALDASRALIGHGAASLLELRVGPQDREAAGALVLEVDAMLARERLVAQGALVAEAAVEAGRLGRHVDPGVGGARGAGGGVAALEEHRVEALAREVEGDEVAEHPAAQHGDVVDVRRSAHWGTSPAYMARAVSGRTGGRTRIGGSVATSTPPTTSSRRTTARWQPRP